MNNSGLSNQAVWKGYNDLATTNPDIAKEWHPTKNGKLKPFDVTAGVNKKIWWRCSEGHEWYTSAATRKKGVGCPICNETRGERRVRLCLTEKNILFVAQYTFENMKHINNLRCDFAIMDIKRNPIAVIEYNGEQHYEPVDFAGKGNKWAKRTFEVIQKRDNVKKEYLQKNGIAMLVIPYWDYENINLLIEEFLEKLTSNYFFICSSPQKRNLQ